jgi:hypothetical protein
MKSPVISGWVTVTGPPHSICCRNNGTTLPLLPRTLPKWMAQTHNRTWNCREGTLPLKDAKLAPGIGRRSQGFAPFDFAPLPGSSVIVSAKYGTADNT